MTIANTQFTVGDRTYEVLKPKTQGVWLRRAGFDQSAAMNQDDCCYIYQHWQQIPSTWPQQQVTLAFPDYSEPGDPMKIAYLRQFGHVWQCFFCASSQLHGPAVYLVRRVS